MTTANAKELGGEPMIPPTLKGRERAKEKIATEFEGDASRISDLARPSISFDTIRQLNDALVKIKGKFKVIRLKDRFEKPLDGYRDILMNVEMSNRHVVEMQLHLAGILKVKNGEGHKLYEASPKIIAQAKSEKRQPTIQERAEIDRIKARSRELYENAFESGKGN